MATAQLVLAIEPLLDGFVADPHPRIAGEEAAQAARDLLWGPVASDALPDVGQQRGIAGPGPGRSRRPALVVLLLGVGVVVVPRSVGVAAYLTSDGRSRSSDPAADFGGPQVLVAQVGDGDAFVEGKLVRHCGLRWVGS